MADSSIGNKQKSTTQITNQIKTAKTEKANEAHLHASTSALLPTAAELFTHIGIVGRPTVWYQDTPAPLLLAWIWSVLLEEMDPKFIPGFIVNQLKAETQPPEHLHSLAQRWLHLDFTDREILRAYADNFMLNSFETFAGDIPDSFLSDLSRNSLNAFYTLYKSGSIFTDF